MPASHFFVQRDSNVVAVCLAVAALLGGALTLSAAPLAPQSGAASTAHYMVFEIGKLGDIQAVSHRVVRMAKKLESFGQRKDRSMQPASASEREGDQVIVRLVDRSEQTVFESAVDVPRFVRGEFSTDGTGQIDASASRLAEPESRTFVVRVPAVEGTRLVLRSESAVTEQSFDLDGLAVDSTLPLASYRPSVEATSPFARPGNRINILVMGDGYQASEQAKFNADAAKTLAAFFSTPPYSTYANFFETATLFTPSAQSGAKHPAYKSGSVGPPSQPTSCGDPQMQSDPLAGTLVNTAFDATFCYANTQRLVGVNFSKIMTAAAAVPDWDKIFLIVNDATYGGAGGSIAVLSTNPASGYIGVHEFGHSFAGLGDEYADPYPSFQGCSDRNGFRPCNPNVTDETAANLIKWSSFIDAATPTPTPGTAGYDGSVGLFEGASYTPTGLYRPQHTCMMRSLGEPLCAVCAQEIILRLYRGGAGTPSAGIDNIEPGSESTAPGPVVMFARVPMTFSVSLLQPAGGPPLSVAWFVNGVLSQSGGASFTFTPPSVGSYTVSLNTSDATPLVKRAMAGTSLDHGRTWNVAATFPHETATPSQSVVRGRG